MPVLEGSGGISDLGEWIRNQVNQDAKQYAGQRPNKMTLGMNL